MSDGRIALQTLLNALADLYSQEERAGAYAATKALRAGARAVPHNPQVYENPYADTISECLTHTPQPIAKSILAAMPYIRWGASDLREGRIPDELANQMPMCELIGPDGLFHSDKIRTGLWMQQTNVVYGPRAHAAEETFLIFAGEAFWSKADDPETKHGSGETIHHPSNIAHKSVTKDKPVLAAWRWSGDIGFNQYELKS